MAMEKIYCHHCGAIVEKQAGTNRKYCGACSDLSKKVWERKELLGDEEPWNKFKAMNDALKARLFAQGINIDLPLKETEDEEEPKTELKVEEAKNYSDESSIGFVLNYIDSYAKSLGIKHWSHCGKNQLEVLVKNVYNSLRDIYDNE